MISFASKQIKNLIQHLQFPILNFVRVTPLKFFTINIDHVINCVRFGQIVISCLSSEHLPTLKMKFFSVLTILLLANSVFSSSVKGGGNCKQLAGDYVGTYIEDEATGMFLQSNF